MAPRLALSRASCSSAGRNRLPTWSARKGGLVRWVIEDSREDRLNGMRISGEARRRVNLFQPTTGVGEEWDASFGRVRAQSRYNTGASARGRSPHRDRKFARPGPGAGD